jgi:ATP-binding cassette subfamily F protein uup
VSKLSGGEKRRLYLLTVLVRNPNFLILDEPTNDLDIVTLQTLEQFLLDFQGCVLIVSHDRYFLDRLVDHVFAFEGNGVVKDFPGNYTDYRQWVYDREDDDDVSAPQIGGSDNEEKNKISVNQVLVSSSDPDSYRDENSQTIQKKKLSFKEQKELETIEADLAQLEKRKAELETLLAGGITDAAEIQKTSLEFNTVSNSIDEKTMRWLELQD